MRKRSLGVVVDSSGANRRVAVIGAGVGVLIGDDDGGVGRTGGSSGAETRQCLGLEVIDLLQEVHTVGLVE